MGRIGQGRGQRAAGDGVGDGQAGKVAERREDVQQIGVAVARLAPRHAGAGEDQRHPHRVLVEVLLAHQAVLADRQAVVAGHDDDGVVGEAALLQHVEQAAGLRVQVGDHRVVLGDVAPHLRLVARVGGQQLVADVQRAVVERVARQEVGRQRQPLRVVASQVLGRHRARVVRGHERHVHQERGRRIGLPELLDRRVAEQTAGVHAGADPVAAADAHLVGGEPVRDLRQRAGVASRRVVAEGRHVPVVLHAAQEDLGAVLEAAVEARRAVVPLAGAPGAVAVAGQVLAEQHVAGGDVLACAFDVEEIAPGVQHRPARHADRAGGAAGDVRVGEGRAAFHQAVEVRGVDLVRAKGADRVEALVVREQDQDVRGRHRGQPTGRVRPVWARPMRATCSRPLDTMRTPRSI